MARRFMIVSADIIVSCEFTVEIDDSCSLVKAEQEARNGASRVALKVIGLGGDTASATVQRLTRLTMKM